MNVPMVVLSAPDRIFMNSQSAWHSMSSCTATIALEYYQEFGVYI